VNTLGDDHAQLATAYSTTEIALFRHITDQIMTARDGRFEVSTMDVMAGARQLHRDGKSGQLTNTQVEDLLDRFVADQWLYKTRYLFNYGG
jgi:hypothetical protein